MRPVTGLTILYDAECGLCTRTRDWIAQQEALVRIRFLASGSPEAKREFPRLPAGELAVVGNTGEVWLGNHAWIVCLWALRGYRDLAFRLTSPLLLLMAREAFAVVSKNRAALSSMLRLRSERKLENQLRAVIVPRCQTSGRWLE
jgi:predicted DCC family thiol-disulfide oxidoreductase YuxK